MSLNTAAVINMVEHNFKVITENATYYFLTKRAALACRDMSKKRGLSTTIMIRLSDNSYVPLDETT